MLLGKIVKHIIRIFRVRISSFALNLSPGGGVRVGSGSYVHPSVHMLGKANIKVGFNSCVSEGCWLNVNHRTGTDVSIDVGNNCFIGKHNFFTSGDKIVISDYSMTTFGCCFLGSSHIYNDPFVPHLVSGTTSSGIIIVGVNCFIGVKAVILGDVSIGYGSIIGAGALVLRDIPPFSLVVGNPAKIIKRYSFNKKRWVEESEFTEADDGALPKENVYLMKLKDNYEKLNIPWIVAGRSMGNL